MPKTLLPENLIGAFFAVGSVGEIDPLKPIEYVSKLQLPYTYQVPKIREEDMVRQFASLIEGFETQGDFILEVDMYTYQEIVSHDEPLLPDEAHSHSLYILPEYGPFDALKTQQTAPATMCFSTRGPDGRQLVSEQMLRFYTSLMERVAKGLVEHLSPICSKLILSQDDPAVSFVIQLIEAGKTGGLKVEQILRAINRVYPDEVIPAYHYCDDWRELQYDGRHLLWDTPPKLAHIDCVRYETKVDSEQAEKINNFLEIGGGLALGVLPNVDEAYDLPIIETLSSGLDATISALVKSGVSIDLISKSCMVSTQCGLSGASPKLTREIHKCANKFPSVFQETISTFS
ncbi:MAG: hypothetical protein BAJATHORv1_110017 [Candidatus Thorarchaeota archaeon]|nr:MAG: hypothetical protein BAJATHORv1_110017 [Candidatus Thorarchaeota archaeon]